MGNKPEYRTKCFFCRGEIPINKEFGQEQWTQDHGYGGYYYRDSYFKLGGSNTVSLTFNPSYLDKLEDEVKQAESEIQRTKEHWLAKINKILEKANKYLGDLSKLVVKTRVEDYSGYDHESESEQRRLTFVKKFFELQTLGYIIEGDGEKHLHSFAAHAACVKPALKLEEIANNPLASEQFKAGLKSLPKSMRQIYNKFKTAEVKVEL